MSISAQTNSEVPSIPLYKLKEIHDLSEAEGRKVFIELTEDEIYPSSHEDDMGETYFHYLLNSYLWNALTLFFKERKDVFVAANMNLYYDKDNPQKWLAPDVLVAFGVENYERRTYKVWQENVFPQVVFEIASDKTWQNDLDEKLSRYEELGAEEYYVLDSEHFLRVSLVAFRRENNKLKTLYLAENRVLSPRLGLEIVHDGTTGRLFDPNKREFLPTLNEAQAEIERLKAEIAKLKGEN